MVDVSLPTGSRARVLFYTVILVGVGLIAFSFAVDHPAAAAAPDLYAGVVLATLAVILVIRGETSEPLMLVAAIALFVGAVGVVYDGLVTLALVPTVEGLDLAANLGLLLGMGLFIYERAVRQPARH